MYYRIKLIVLFFCLLAGSGCKNSFDEPIVSAGNADFSSFVALGGYYVSGFGDGALHYQLQKNSFPAILASRFALVGGGTFKQPLVNEGPGLAYDENNNLISKLTLQILTNCKGSQELVPLKSIGDASNEVWIGPNGPYNNLAVPGAKSFNLSQQTFGRALPLGNLYYHRFASDNVASSTILSDAQKINPTFFVLWVGNEDVWQYAKSGGKGDLDSIGLNDITPVRTFGTAYSGILSTLLTGNKPKGAVANIPDIDCFPFFTAIPYNGLVLTASQASALNGTSGFTFSEGANPFVVYPPNSLTSRQLMPGEFILLTIPEDSINCNAWGTPQRPIPDSYVLDSAEVAIIRSYTRSYNDSIRAAVIKYDLALVDMQSFFQTFKTTQTVNGVNYSNQFLKNSIFSLDGLYPNARGQAHIANAFIRAINSKYMSTLPEVDVNSFRGNNFP